MGYVPIVALRPRSASAFLQLHERRLSRELRGRSSRFAYRRRRAYDACLTLIRAREADLGRISDPWAPPTKPPPKPGTSTAERIETESYFG